MLLFVSALAQAGSDDQLLQDLATRAQERAVWPQLRRLAERADDLERRGRAYLVLGYREYDAGEFEAAMQDLRAAAETGFSLTDHVRYYGADAAHEAGQLSQTVAVLQDFRALHPGSTLRLEALELLAKTLLSVGQPEDAIRALVAEPTVRRRPELAVLLAQAYGDERNPEEAARVFQEVYYAFPLASQAASAREAIARLREELGPRFPEATEEIQTARVEILASKSRWQEALDEFTSLLENRPASPMALRWQFGRARCLLRLKEPDQVIAALTGSFPGSPEFDAQRLALLIDAYLQKSDPSAALLLLEQLRTAYPSTRAYAVALSSLGNFYVRQADWKEAARHYATLFESFAQTDAAHEAYWRLVWSYYLDGDLTRAYQGFVEHLHRYPDSEHAPGAVYWLARIAEHRSATAEARSLYAFLRRRFVHSYYAQQAESRLAALEDSSAGQGAATEEPAGLLEAIQKVPPREAPPLRPCEVSPESDALRPFLILKSLNLRDLAEQYLLAALDESPSATELRLALCRFRASENKTALALLDARHIAPRTAEYEFSDLPEEIWRWLYPQDYLALVKRYARANRLDPGLVLGLIRQESAFNPRATSSADARGLMQILPQTASPRRRGRARVARRLYEPAYNLRFGTRYLRSLLKMTNGIPEEALAAYHAGDFRVKDWLSKRSFREPAEFLETIPIPATRAYVEAVLRDAAIYRQLLSGKAKFTQCRSQRAAESR